ncbi:MAG: prohead protease/major capsid protein fusion protein, partial [Pseudomonadota bacterium]
MIFCTRAANLRPSTLDPEARTVEAVVSTGADVPRPGFVERLPLAAADLSRLEGAPVLDAHQRSSMAHQLGVIENARIAPEGLVVRMRFRTNPETDALMSDIAAGSVRGLSVGYSVPRWRESREGGQRVRTAESWMAREVSVVPVAADPGAHFRSQGVTMEPETEVIEAVTGTPNPATIETRAETNRAIRSIAATAGLTRAWADDQIDRAATLDAARADAFEAMRTRQAATPTPTTRIEVGIEHEAPDAIATRAGEALYARTAPAHQLSEQARPWAGMTTRDLAADCLRRSGASIMGASTETLITRALHSATDFPLILGDAVNRGMRAAYETPSSGVRQLARQTMSRDFRAKRRLQLSQGPTLEKVGETGEFTQGSLEESEEFYAVETFGRIIAVSRQMLINDDVGAFADVSGRMGVAARTFENARLTAKLVENPLLSDGIAVFDAAGHSNQAAQVATIEAALDAARTSMRRQTDASGQMIEVAPRFVLVPPDLETEMQRALAEVAANETAQINPFSALSLLVEPRLAAPMTWYVVADPATIDGLEWAYLEGAP